VADAEESKECPVSAPEIKIIPPLECEECLSFEDLIQSCPVCPSFQEPLPCPPCPLCTSSDHDFDYNGHDDEDNDNAQLDGYDEEYNRNYNQNNNNNNANNINDNNNNDNANINNNRKNRMANLFQRLMKNVQQQNNEYAPQNEYQSKILQNQLGFALNSFNNNNNNNNNDNGTQSTVDVDIILPKIPSGLTRSHLKKKSDREMAIVAERFSVFGKYVKALVSNQELLSFEPVLQFLYGKNNCVVQSDSHPSMENEYLADDWSFLQVKVAVREDKKVKEVNERSIDVDLQENPFFLEWEERINKKKNKKKMKNDDIKDDNDNDINPGSSVQFLHKSMKEKSGVIQDDVEEEEMEEVGEGAGVPGKKEEKLKINKRWVLVASRVFYIGSGRNELESIIEKYLKRKSLAKGNELAVLGGKEGALKGAKSGTEMIIVHLLARIGISSSASSLIMTASMYLAIEQALNFLKLNTLNAAFSSKVFASAASQNAASTAATLTATQAITVAAKANVIGSIVAFLVQELWIIIQYYRGCKSGGTKGISLQQFKQDSITNLVSSGSGFVGAVSGAAIGTLIAPGPGTFIGALIGSLLFGILSALGMNGLWKKIEDEKMIKAAAAAAAAAAEENESEEVTFALLSLLSTEEEPSTTQLVQQSE